MRYGHFDDQRREYVITQPDTPLPWINYLGSEAYFGIISNTAGGYSFYRDARLRRLDALPLQQRPLRLRRALHLPARRRRGKRANISGRPSWQPTRRRLDDYTCRHGLGYTIIGSTYRQIEAADRVLCAAGRKPGNLAADADQPARKAGQALGLLQRRVLPVGRPGRRRPTSSATSTPARWRSKTA